MDVSAAVSSIPPVTRAILLATAVVTGPCLLQFVSPFHTTIMLAEAVALSWSRIRYHYEIWRPLSAFFYGGGGFPLLYDVFLIFRNSSTLEKDTYRGDTAEYAWVYVMIGTATMVLNLIAGHPFLFRPLLHAQTYLWCRAHPTMKVSIFGLITIPTSLYPPALIGLDLLTGGPHKAIGGIMGLIAGHFWWFCSTYLPLYAPAALKRPNPFKAPTRFRACFARPPRTASASASGPSSASATARATDDVVNAVRHRWGGGQRLGGETL